MPTYQLTGPNGKKYRVEGDSPEGAMQALRKMFQQTGQSQHREFDGSEVPGYNPETGIVERKAEPSRGVAATMSALDAFPVTGPFVRSGVENAAAGAMSLLTGKPQAEIRAEMGEMTDEAQKAYPYTSGAAGIGGGVVGLLPAIAAAPAAFGAGTGGGLLGVLTQMGTGTLSGSLVGGADAAVRSGADAEEIKNGAMWGGGLGMVGAPIGHMVGAGLRKGLEFLRGAPSKAQVKFTEALERDVVDDPVARLQDLGPEAMPMDLGANLRGQAGALASTPGRGQEIVRTAIRDRNAGANQRIRSEVDATLGPAQVPSEIDARIVQKQRALDPEYDLAFRRAKAVNTTDIANQLESDMVNLRGDAQKAAQRIRKMLDVTGTDQLDPHPGTLFQTRQAIDGMMETATDSKVKAFLTRTRKAIDAELARAVPDLKRVDARFAEFARQREALTTGQQLLDSGRTAMRPQELDAYLRDNAMTPAPYQQPSLVPQRLREGARAEIERIIGTNANDRVALQRLIKGEGDWNRDRLAILFGKDKAERIIKVLDRERTFYDTSQEVTGNSLTAARQQAQTELGIRGEQKKGAVRSALNLNAGDAAASLIDRMTGGVREASKQRMHEELGRLLANRDPQALQAVVRLVDGARRRGDITARQASEIVQSLMQSSATGAGDAPRRPLELTIGGAR